MNKDELLLWAKKIIEQEVPELGIVGSGRKRFLDEIKRHQCPGCNRILDHRLDGQECNTCAVERRNHA